MSGLIPNTETRSMAASCRGNEEDFLRAIIPVDALPGGVLGEEAAGGGVIIAGVVCKHYSTTSPPCLPPAAKSESVRPHPVILAPAFGHKGQLFARFHGLPSPALSQVSRRYAGTP